MIHCTKLTLWQLSAPCYVCGEDAQPAHQVRDEDKGETRFVCDRHCPVHVTLGPLPDRDVVTTAGKQTGLFNSS
jgi:hypothetical protein